MRYAIATHSYHIALRKQPHSRHAVILPAAVRHRGRELSREVCVADQTCWMLIKLDSVCWLDSPVSAKRAQCILLEHVPYSFEHLLPLLCRKAVTHVYHVSAGLLTSKKILTSCTACTEQTRHIRLHREQIPPSDLPPTHLRLTGCDRPSTDMQLDMDLRVDRCPSCRLRH